MVHVKAKGKLLYDVAAILSHDEMGHMQRDRQDLSASTYICRIRTTVEQRRTKKLAQVVGHDADVQ